jgi:hypothetical protein
MKITELKPNPNNPRLIKDDKFKKLCDSIQAFPKMMELRPIIIDEGNIILGGNMRFNALKHLGYKELPVEWVKQANELTEEQKQEFIVKDNVGFGEWDWDILANEWDTEKLGEWGLELPVVLDYSDKNKEIDIDSLDGEMIIKLKYTEKEYNQVREQLSKIAATPEQAVWKLLGNE